jgi:hypothetical protein
MQCCKKDATFIVNELKFHFQKHPQQCNMSSINDILETLGHRLDSQLMERIVHMLSAVGLKKDQRTYEIFLSMQFTIRNFEQVQQLIEEMREAQIPLTERALVICFKVALRKGNFSEALTYYQEAKLAQTKKDASLDHLVSQLVELACKESQLHQLLPTLNNATITEDAANTMLTECARLRDAPLARSVEQLVRGQDGAISDVTYGLLIRAFAKRVCTCTKDRE